MPDAVTVINIQAWGSQTHKRPVHSEYGYLLPTNALSFSNRVTIRIKTPTPLIKPIIVFIIDVNGLPFTGENCFHSLEITVCPITSVTRCPRISATISTNL